MMKLLTINMHGCYVKDIILFFIFSFLFVASSYGDTLRLEIKNSFNDDLKIRIIDSNEILPFEPIKIEAGGSKMLDLNFAKKFYLNLVFINKKDKLVTEFQIVHNYSVNRDYNFIVPAGGVLTAFECAWNYNNIIVNEIQGYEYYSWLSWLPWLPVYDADVKITVTPRPNASKLKDSVEFTLFALPISNKIKKIKLNSNIKESAVLCKDKVNLKSWGIEEKLLLNPIVFKKNKFFARWVDLIIHNYSIQSWILYGIIQDPDMEHIKFNYPEMFIESFTIFYPPQTQLRGPGFRFGVKKEKDLFTVFPAAKQKIDRFLFVIGRKESMLNNDLEFIPLELVTEAALGKCIKGGVNIKGHDGYAYQAGFIPLNARFAIREINPDLVLNKINMPVDKNGLAAFNLSAMEDVRITSESQFFGSNNFKSNGKVGIKYIISGKSAKTGKRYNYRLILIAPPFLAGNTPGNYSPNTNVASNSNIGNYLRYPLHLYLIPVDDEGMDIISTEVISKTDLPNNIIGSIEYFISDRITTNKR
jgi:hypothetical protein